MSCSVKTMISPSLYVWSLFERMNSELMILLMFFFSYIRNAINPKKKKARSKNWSEVQTILLKGNDVNCAIEDES